MLKVKVGFLRNLYHFCISVRSTNQKPHHQKWSHCKSGTICILNPIIQEGKQRLPGGSGEPWRIGKCFQVKSGSGKRLFKAEETEWTKGFR